MTSVRFVGLECSLESSNVCCVFLKFVPTIYDEPALQVLTGYHNEPANRIAHCSIIVNTRNKLPNKHWNFVTNIQTYIDKRTLEVIFQKQIEIERKLKIQKRFEKQPKTESNENVSI